MKKISVIFSIVIALILTSINSTYAYKEYGDISVQKAKETYLSGQVELVQGVKVFGDVDTFNKYGLTKEKLLELDKIANDYTVKSGNFVGIGIFGKGSNCKSIDDCKELNMAVKGLSDNGVVILIMDNGNFTRNMSVISDPKISDFFNTNDEQSVINNLLKPSLKSNTANDGLTKSINYVMKRLGDTPTGVQREERAKRNAELALKQAEQAKIEAQNAKIQAEKNKIIEAENLKKQEELNKKIVEMLMLGLKGLVGLFVGYIVYLFIASIVRSIRFSLLKKRLYKLIENGNVTVKVLEILIQNGDLEKNSVIVSVYKALKEKVENSNIESLSSDKDSIKKVEKMVSDMETVDNDMNVVANSVAEDKLTIDNDLDKAIKDYDLGFNEVQEKINEIEIRDIENVSTIKNELIDSVNKNADIAEKYKVSIKSDKSELNLIEKRDFIKNLNIIVEEMKSDVNQSIFSINDIVEKLQKSKDNKKKLQDITSINL